KLCDCARSPGRKPNVSTITNYAIVRGAPVASLMCRPSQIMRLCAEPRSQAGQCPQPDGARAHDPRRVRAGTEAERTGDLLFADLHGRPLSSAPRRPT